MKSTHLVEVVPIRLEPHPNADSLSVVRVFDGYTCCVRTADWVGKTKGAYIPPDSVVDSSRAEFAFLAGHERIKVKKLRGIVSMARGEEPNSATTHFFILVGEGSHLDGTFTAFGKVISGIEVADAINRAPAENEKPVVPVRIKHATVAPCQK